MGPGRLRLAHHHRGTSPVTTIADLCQDMPIATFAPGTILIAEGQETDRLYVLTDGSVEVVKDDVRINLVSDRGAIFGDMSALLDVPHTATVRAVSLCRAHVIEGADVFLQAHPEVAYQLAKLLAQRLQGVTSYLVDLKHQFEDQANHLGMVDEILESLLNQQRSTFTPGSDRDPEY
jgi:CRP/FNR family transcriptional regulator, cyclic AMP receptor protein